jgi:hypothetical protein
MQGEYCNQHAQICIIGKIISYHLENARLQNAPKFEIANGSSDTFAVGAGAVVLTMKTINIALLIIAILLIFMIIINSDLSSVTPSTIVLQNAQLN